MADVIQITRSEQELAEGARSPDEVLLIPPYIPVIPEVENIPVKEFSIRDFPVDEITEKSPELEVLYFKSSHGPESVHESRPKSNVQEGTRPSLSDPYNELISTASAVSQHLEQIRDCISRVQEILEDPCPGLEDEFPGVTRIQAWKYVLESGIQCLGNPRFTDRFSRKAVKDRLMVFLGSAIADVKRVDDFVRWLIKSLENIEKHVDKIQLIAAKNFKENLVSAGTAQTMSTQLALNKDAKHDHTNQLDETKSREKLPQAIITLKHLWIRSGVYGISLKTGSRPYWINLLTLALPHKFQILSIFLNQIQKIGNEIEEEFKTAQNILLISTVTDDGRNETECCSVQALVSAIQMLLKSNCRKKRFTPKEQVIGLRTCWKLKEEFVQTKNELILVQNLMSGFRDAVTGVYNNRKYLLNGRPIYFAGSQRLKLLIENIGIDVDIKNLFDTYAEYGSIETNECGDSSSEINTNSRGLSSAGSDFTLFTVLESTESLNDVAHGTVAKVKSKSELDLPYAEIVEEYQTVFARVKTFGTLTDSDIRLCSDIVVSFLECSNCLAETLETNTEKLRSGLRYFESDAYKEFPGILVWVNLVIKTFMLSNFSPVLKHQLRDDLLSLFETQEQLISSITKHESALQEFKDYVNEFLQGLRYRDSMLANMMEDVIPDDHFTTMLSYTEQKLLIPNVHAERDEFSIRISISTNECRIFSIPASDSTEGTRIVKFSLLEKRDKAYFLIQVIEFIKSLMSTTKYLLDSCSNVLGSKDTGRTLKIADLHKNLFKFQPFEKLAILIRAKAVLTNLAKSFVIFEEVRQITRQLNGVMEAFKLLLHVEGFQIPKMDHIKLDTVAPWIPAELRKQFTSFKLYHFIPTENPVIKRILGRFHGQHGLTLTRVIQRQDDLLGFRSSSHKISPAEALKLKFKRAMATVKDKPDPGPKIFKKIPLRLFLREIPKLVNAVVDEHAEAKAVSASTSMKMTHDPVAVDNRMCVFFNAFTHCLQSKILQSVQNLHLPKASIYVEKLSETRPIVGHLEALCFFIGLASVQLNSNTLPSEVHIYEKLRPKFLAFTSALVAFQNTRKEVYAYIWKKVEATLSTLEYENKDKLEQIHGEVIPELDELHLLSPIPPHNVLAAIWESDKEAKAAQTPIPKDKLVIFHWNVWKYETLEIEHKAYVDVFEFSGMTFRSRAKLLHHMMDQALAVLNKSLILLKDSKADITEAGRVIASIKTYLYDLDQDCQIRPEQVYVILRTLRARIVGVSMYLDRSESVLKRCRFFLSHGIRHIRAHLHEVQSFHRNFEANPFHYLTLRVELELAQPMSVFRHVDATAEQQAPGSITPPRTEHSNAQTIGDHAHTQDQDHARTVLKFFESFGNQVHRLGNVFVSGLQNTHTCLSSPSACADSSVEPVPKIVGLAILIGHVMMEIRTYSEMVAKENSIVTLVQDVEKAVEDFPNRNSNRMFARNIRAKLLESLDGTEGTITKISNLLNAPFNMAGGLEPKIQVKSNIDSALFPSQSDTSLPFDGISQTWYLGITDSSTKLLLVHVGTAETYNFADLNTMKQVGILKQLLQTLQEVLRQGSKTLESDGIASIKDVGARLKLVKQSLKIFLKNHPPNADETFDLSTILDDLHFSMELVKSTWTQINSEMQATLKIVTCAAAYMRLRFVTAGINATATYLPTTTRNPHPLKRKQGAPAQTHRELQIQRKYISKVGEVEEHLRSLVVSPLSIPLSLNLPPPSQNLS